MQAGIYARYSTEHQSDRSIEDQFALCEAYAAREGLTIAARFEDRARSGGSTIGRDGLAAMMRAAGEGRIQVVVVEALDRISRDMEDLAAIYKRLNFAGVAIRAVHEGQINTVLVGLRGVIGQLQREDGAQKTRRGMAGRAESGLIASGLSYGYKPVPGQPGRRIIDAEQAAIVRRIFAEYLAGASTRRIAQGLNTDGTPAPRAKFWRPTTIKTSGAIASGILQNPIYCGRAVWGRARNVRNPDTGRIVQRSSEARVTTDIPELAIIPHGLWDAAQAAMAARQSAPFSERRTASFALSGLLKCGCCGGNLISNGTDRRGRRRIRCVSVTDTRPCDARRTIYLDTVQTAIIDALRAEMRHPSIVAEFVRTYHEERRRLAATETGRRTTMHRRMDELTRERDRLVDCIAKGFGDASVLGPRATAAHHEIATLAAAIAAQPAPLNVIALHPAALARYETLLANLQDALVDSDEAIRDPLRELIERVTIHAPADRAAPITIEISGRLNALLGVSSYPDGVWAQTPSRRKNIQSPQHRGPLFSITVAA